MHDDAACDDPIPAAADQKINGNAFEDQTEKIKPESPEKAVRQNQSKSDEAKKKKRVKRVVIAFFHDKACKEEKTEVCDDHQAVETRKICPE
jgi:hypothetical protein